MRSRSERSSSRLLIAAIVAACAFVGDVGQALATPTPPNTIISNTSSASYSDVASNAYTANSNTVTVTVQNAPSITLAPVNATATVAPGQTVTDSFTITNTGNAAGDVQFTAGGVTGAGTDNSYASSATFSYTNGGTTTPEASLAALNTALQSVQVAEGAAITVSVIYPLQTGATALGTVTTALTGTITYAAVGGAAQQTSTALVSAPETDTVQADVRLDVALSATQDPSSGVVTYQLKAADGTGTWGAKDSAAVKLLLGTATGGVFISAKIPQFNAVPLAISGNASVTAGTTAAGYPISVATPQIYYTTNATGIGGSWTQAAGGVIGAGATYIGVFISGGTCTINGASMANVDICPATTPTSTPGVVNTPAITLTFAVVPPSGTGSADTGSISTFGNSIIGDNATTEHVIAPGITLNSLPDASATISNLTNAGVGLNNTTPTNAPSGASTIQANQALAAYVVLNGPYGNAGATGQYDGIGSNDNNHDFTAVSFVSTNAYTTTNTTGGYTATTTSVTAAVVSSIPVESTILNNGNKADVYNIVATAPTGWKVTLGTDPNPGTGLCTGSVSWGGSAQSALSGTSTAANVNVPSGATVNYCAIYWAPAGVTYLSHAVDNVVATSTNLGTGLGTNTTYHLLYAGFVAVTTTQTITSTGCPGGVVPGSGVCPSGVIQYTIDYHNVVNPLDTSSAPAQSFKGVMTKAGTLVITADGSNGSGLGNNWGAFSGGASQPADTTGATNSVFAYYTGAAAGTGPTAVWQAGVTKFTAQIGGPTFQLMPALYGSGVSQGTITYSVTVN
jgi:hypothetical protein